MTDGADNSAPKVRGVPFVPGDPRANKTGRPKGSRNKLGEDFLKALHEDFIEHGVEAIEACRNGDPVQYVKVIASILPKELNVTIDPLDELSDDELIERIRSLDTALSAALGRDSSPEAEAISQGASAGLPALRPH